MKMVELTTVAQSVEELLDLVSVEDEVLLLLPNGKVFLLASVNDSQEDDDFADEIARTRQHATLMEMLRERSHEQPRYSSQSVRERLDLQKP